MRIFIACFSAAALFVAAPASAETAQHRPMKSLNDFSIAPSDWPTGCEVHRSYGRSTADDRGEITCTDEATLNLWFEISSDLKPDCKATGDKRWQCSYSKP